MPRSILLSQFFLPLSAASLGCFVTGLDNPHQDYHNPICNASPEAMEKVQTQLQLTSFLSSSFSKRLKASIRITADQAKMYYLNNAGQWFRHAVQSRETREWIERTIDEGEDIYVVVAYHTLLDARIIELGEQGAAGGNLVISPSTALTASGVVVPFSNVADPGPGGFRGRIEDKQRQFTALGEQIYAVQYRKVCCRWFARNKVDEMTLAKKTWWERYDKPRYLQSEIEDNIEVELEEDEIALEGDRDECAIESGEVFVSAA
jgi:hypothetical protein